MDASKDLYKILGVGENASDDEIKKKFRDLSKKYHPDKNKDDKSNDEKYKEITQAYDILKDPEKRKKYDQFRKYGFQGNFTGGQNINFEDLFSNAFHGSGGNFQYDFGGESAGGFGSILEQLFSSAQRGRRGRSYQSSRPATGPDIHTKIDVPFLTAALGGEVTIQVQRPDTGQTQKLSVKIPPGTADESKIRLRGQGSPGQYGGAAGDLIITVHIQPHQNYRRDGLNIEVDLSINLAQAILGSTLPIQTIHGKTINLKIKSGTQGGTTLRLPGMGIRTTDKSGDMLVHINIRVPENLSVRQRQKIEELAAEFNLDY